MSEEVGMDGSGNMAFVSHGSGYFIPYLIEQLSIGSEMLKEGRHAHAMGRSHIEPLNMAYETYYIKIWGFIRSTFSKKARGVIETEFKNIHELIHEINKEPSKRTLRKDTMEIYGICMDKLTNISFTINDFIQGVKQLLIRIGENKDDLFNKSIANLEKQMGADK